ncbi:MAG: sulfatase [Planctomycetota bacterium]
MSLWRSNCPLAIAALLATSLLHAPVAMATEPASRPNVIFILADDLGWSDTSLNGQTRFHQTPNLNRLAQRGMTFTRAYSASPLCSPTRSAILTGMSPARTGITVPNGHLPQVVLGASVAKAGPPHQKVVQPQSATRLKTEYHTLAESLKEAGYATGHFGKWHLGTEPYSPLQQGFDSDLPHHPGPGPAGSYVAPWKFRNFQENSAGEHIEDRMAREAVAWMEKHRDQPFFMNYWMFSVHAPFDAKKELIEKHRARVDPNDPQRSPTYAAMVESMDDAIGTLLDALDRLELADNTIIVFTADNGGNMYNVVDGVPPTSNRPLRGGKATLFEGGTRVPCVIAWPGVTTPGSRSDAMIQSEDYYPTLLAGLGLIPPASQPIDGTDFSPALRGDDWNREAIFQYFPHSPNVPDALPPAVSIHRDDWKMIRIFHDGEKGGHQYLLYRLTDDLGETSNLASSNPEIVRELDARIDRFLANTKAVVPLPNPAYDPSAKAPGPPRRQPPPPRDPGERPEMHGWKTRGCTADVNDGIATIQSTSDQPFLGFALGKIERGARLRFRIKSKEGRGSVAWLPSPTADPSESPQPVEFKMKNEEWQELEVEIPAPGDVPGIVRLFLPTQNGRVEVDWIELETVSTPRRWDF